MKETTITITIPDGYDDIDKKALAEGKISFIKTKPTPWRKTEHNISGFYVDNNSCISVMGPVANIPANKNLFVSRDQARAMLAMAQLSQIIANDKRFGEPITEEEWKDATVCKRLIIRQNDRITTDYGYLNYCFLAFHTVEQRDLFLEENEDLIKQYYMLN